MNTSILNSFLADQRRAKRLMSVRFGIPEDIRALDWVLCSRELREAYDVCPFASIFRIHGYGLEIQVDDLYVDFDYSIQGWADGFDSWRIFVYIMAGRFDNRGPDKQVSDRVDEWFRELIQLERIEKRDNLYYLKQRPASGAERSDDR